MLKRRHRLLAFESLEARWLLSAAAPVEPAAAEEVVVASAFPGAEGFGAQTVGGRGGTVIEVTNLNSAGPGSLRAAIEAEGPRIVVFRVSGTIALHDSLRIENPFITIAGQSAPGGGITLKNYQLSIRTHDVIVRYLRIRTGPTVEEDSISLVGAENVILDHNSFSWATDENASATRGSKNITMQWNIISEGLHNSTHPDGAHSMGSLFSGVTNLSLHHNLYAHNNARNARVGDADNLYGVQVVDMVNNVFYNWGERATEVKDYVDANIVGNYYKVGPDTAAWQEAGLPEIMLVGNDIERSIFVEGNYAPQCDGLCEDDWHLVGEKDGDPALRDFQSLTRHDAPLVTTTSAQTAYDQVLAEAGARRPMLDSVDQRILFDVINGTGQIIDDPSDVGSWPVLDWGEAPPDADHDGMPDAWEIEHGFDPNDPADGPLDTDGDGYTNIEEWLNNTPPAGAPPQAIDDNAYTDEGAPVAITLTGSDPDGDPLTYIVETPPANGQLTGDAPNLTYTPNPGYSGTDSFTFKVNDGQFDSTIATVNINVASNSSLLEVQVSSSTDDAEESGSGSMNLDSSDLDLGIRPVGLRFNGIDIPQGAAITNAYVQFTADESNATATNLIFHGQASDHAAAFTSADGNITSRPTTSASVAWATPEWTAGESGTNQRTPDLSAVIQEIVNRSGWSNGNSLALVLTGSGNRAAESLEGTAQGAARLVVEYNHGNGVPNTSPTISDLADQVIDEDTSTGAIAFTVGDAETPAASLTITASSSNPTLVPQGNIVFGGSGASRTVTVTPASNQFGTATITVNVTDSGGLTAADTFVLTVNGANDPPAISDIGDQQIDQNTSTGAIAFTVGDSETPAGSLALSGASSNTTLVPDANIAFGGSGANRTITVTPAGNQFGTAMITVTVTDSGGLTAVDTFQLVVNDVNDPPVANSQTSATSDAPVAITLTGSDPDGDPLTYIVETPPANGQLTGDAPNLTYTPNPGYSGTDSFTFKVNDGQLDSNIATVEINVGAAFNTIQAQALTSTDDAEQSRSGKMNLTSRDLDLGARPVAIRFSGLNIPQGATITNAYLQFTADKSGSKPTNLTIAAHAADNAAAFTNANDNITSRPTTSASVDWTVPDWTAGDSGAAQQSPDLTAMIQEIIDRGGWSSGNALALIITGNGARAADSVDGNPTAAPRLVIEYQ